MTILVTGGAGYIGSHMVHALVDAGEDVVVLDNLSTGFRFLIPATVPIVVGSTGDRELVAKLIDTHRVTAIVHFAASIVVPESVRDPLGYYHNNTMNTCLLLQTAVAGGVRHFIFSSTAAVYGNPDHSPVREDAATRPISPYGSSKLMSEIMLHDTARAHDLRFVVLRYFNVAGADPQQRTGQSTAGATHLIKVACETALGSGPRSTSTAPTIRPPDGTCIRDYIHVSDLVRAHSAALAYLRSRRRQRDLQLRLRPWRLGARGAGRGQARQRPRFPGRGDRPPPRRSGRPGGRRRPHPPHARLAAAIRRPRHHRRPCARLGTPADEQQPRRRRLSGLTCSGKARFFAPFPT